MDTFGIISRLVVVCFSAIILSILAVLTVKWSGLDIKDPKERNHPWVLGIAGIFNLLFIVVIASILRYWDKQGLSILGFTLGLKDFSFALVVLFLSLGLSIAYIFSLHRKGIINVRWALKKNHAGLVDILILVFGFIVLFLAALQEEIMFRGYFSFILLPSGFYLALLISTFVFTAWHFLTNKVNLFQSVDWFFGGIMLFYLYWFSKSIWLAAIIHFSRNITNVLVFNISGKHSLLRFEKPIPAKYKTLYMLIYSLVILALGYLFYN